MSCGEVDVLDDRLMTEITHLDRCCLIRKTGELIVTVFICCRTIGEFWEINSYADKFLSTFLVSDGSRKVIVTIQGICHGTQA